MTLLFAWLKSKLLGNGLSVGFIAVIGVIILIVVFPNLDQIRERFGLETRTGLKLALQNQQAAVDVLQASNTNLEATLKTSFEIDHIMKDAVVEQAAETQAVQQQVEQIISHKKAAIRNLKTQPVSSENRIQQQTDISRTQIMAIWETYCHYNTCQKG